MDSETVAFWLEVVPTSCMTLLCPPQSPTGNCQGRTNQYFNSKPNTWHYSSNMDLVRSSLICIWTYPKCFTESILPIGRLVLERGWKINWSFIPAYHNQISPWSRLWHTATLLSVTDIPLEVTLLELLLKCDPDKKLLSGPHDSVRIEKTKQNGSTACSAGWF